MADFADCQLALSGAVEKLQTLRFGALPKKEETLLRLYVLQASQAITEATVRAGDGHPPESTMAEYRA